jgi:6-phosphogluconolactonase (cycloisomerase 2 family)
VSFHGRLIKVGISGENTMNFQSRIGGCCAVIFTGMCVAGGVFSSARADEDGAPGAVYTLGNDAGGNQLIVFKRNDDGGLSLAGTVATGGLGLGSGLGSQGSLITGKAKRVLYAVNAGSHNITTFKIGKKGPEAIQLIDSAGLQPISLTAREDTLYVLNNGSAAGDVDQITGFRIDDDSHKLTLLQNSTMGLSAGSVGPAEVGFKGDGKVLVVTEKSTSNIDTFRVDKHGYAGGLLVSPASGTTPYGFAFNSRGYLIDSEAFGGAAGASAVSSYRVDSDSGIIQVVSPSVSTGQTAACWIAVTRNGRYTYASNTGSGTITGYRVDDGGNLTLLDANGVTGTTGGAPADSAVVGNRFLYVLSHDQGEGVVTAFEIKHDGSLDLLGSVGGLPASTVGLAAE